MKKKRGKRILFVVLSVVLVLVLAAGVWAGNFFYDLALNRYGDRSAVIDSPQNEVDYGEEPEKRYSIDRAWFDESGWTMAQIDSRDGTPLVSYVIENEDPTGNWVIISHGYGSAGWFMVSWARQFYQWGYNVLMPDARGCGQSGGQYYGMGWDDRWDLIDWIDQVNDWHAPNNIVLYGISMGGATVMMATGEALPENVRAAVEDCGYTSAYEEFSYQLRGIFGLPSFPLMQFSSAVARARAGYWLHEADSVKQLQKSVTPTLFIHGAKDTFVPAYMVDVLYEAAVTEKEKLVIEGAGHGGASTTDPELFWGTIKTFLDRHLV